MPRAIHKPLMPPRVAAAGLPLAVADRPRRPGVYPAAPAPIHHGAVPRPAPAERLIPAVFDLMRFAPRRSALPGVGMVYHPTVLPTQWHAAHQLRPTQIGGAIAHGWRLIHVVPPPGTLLRTSACLFLLPPARDLFAALPSDTYGFLADHGVVPTVPKIRSKSDLRHITGDTLATWAQALGGAKHLALWARIEHRRPIIGFGYGPDVPPHIAHEYNYAKAWLRCDEEGHWFLTRIRGASATALADHLRNRGITVPAQLVIRTWDDIAQIHPRAATTWANALGGTSRLAMWVRLEGGRKAKSFGVGRRLPPKIATHRGNFATVLLRRSPHGHWGIAEVAGTNGKTFATLLARGGFRVSQLI